MISAGVPPQGAGPGGRRVRHTRRFPIFLLVTLLSLLPRLGAGQESWLDSQQGGWNQPGGAIPAPPVPVAAESAYCQDLVRPVETTADVALTAQGWRLF